jgi:hypothetical protein
VLPTDPAFLQLNFFQKLMLLSFINEDEAKQFDMVKTVLEYMKPYMNLELYKYEKESQNKTPDGTVVNAVFAYQSKIGHATGKAQSPLWMRKALAQHFAEVEARKPKKVIWSDDPNILG